MIAYELDSVSTDFTDVNQILESLQKNYKKDFPEVKTMKYDLKALPEDQSAGNCCLGCPINHLSGRTL